MICSIIPARGGSKSIYKKNISLLKGKPLIHYTIEAALKSKKINKILVSTDDSEIAKSIKKFNVDIIKRPKSLSKDTTKMLPVIQHAINKMDLDKSYEKLILLQPTSPLRKAKHIDEAITMLDNDYTSVISVCETEHTPYKMYLNKDNELIDFISKKYRGENKQNLQKVYRENGAIYVSWINNLVSGIFRGKKIRPYPMSHIESIDIDFDFDMFLCEKILEKID